MDIRAGKTLQKHAGGAGETSLGGYLSNDASLTFKADGVQSWSEPQLHAIVMRKSLSFSPCDD